MGRKQIFKIVHMRSVVVIPEVTLPLYPVLVGPDPHPHPTIRVSEAVTEIQLVLPDGTCHLQERAKEVSVNCRKPQCNHA